MQAVILAAGRGKRLRPYTDKVPKPMVPVLGKPILEHTLNALPDEITEVILIIGYLGERIKEYFGDEFGDKKINYIHQEEQLGTFHALSLAIEMLDDAFLVLFADDFYKKEDIRKLLKHERAILTQKKDDVSRFGCCAIDPENRLKCIVEKPENGTAGLVNVGAYKLTKHIFDEEIVIGKSGEQLLPPMIGNLTSKMDVFVEQADFWLPVAYPEDIRKAEEAILKLESLLL